LEEVLGMDDTKASLLLSRRVPGGAQDVFSSICNRFRFAPAATLNQALEKLGSLANEHGRIQSAILYSVLEDYDLALSDYEQSYVNKRFGFNNSMLLPKFIESLDILPPKTHVEPEAFHDTLPQPYRMISKIIELDILDTAWLEITRLHPDIMVNSDGKPLMVPRNNCLKNVASAASIYDPDSILASLSNTVSMKNGIGQYISSILKSQNKIDENTVQTEYKFALLDSNNDKIAHSINVILESDNFRVLANPWIVSNTLSSMQTETEVICARVCIGAICMKKERQVSTEPPKKGAPAEAVIKDILMVKTLLVDVYWLNSNVQSKSHEVRIRVAVDLDRPLFNTALPSEMTDPYLYKMNASLDTCDNGETLLFSSGAVCEIYKVISSEAAYLLYVAPAKGQPAITIINEHETPAMAPISAPEVLETPSFTLISTIDSTLVARLGNANIISAKFAMQSYNISTKPNSNNDSKDKPGITSYSVCLLLENTMEWYMISFEKVIKLVPDAPPAEIAVPAKGAPKGKAAAPAVETPKEITVPKFTFDEKYFSFISGKWKLSSPVSCVNVDENQTVLALGHQNGLVTLWDISSRQYISSISHHEGLITCISISSHPNNNRDLIITAGSSIGSISFHMLKQTDVNQGRNSYSTDFLDYRVDLLGRPVIQLNNLQLTTFVTAVFEEGLVALYDSFKGKLIGQFALYIGMEARQTPSDVAYFEEMETSRSIKRKPLPSLQQLNESRPPRNHKLAVSSIPPNFFAKLFSHNIVFSYSNGRIYMIFMKNFSNFCLARFNLQDILTICYPGLEACKDLVGGQDSSVIDWPIYSSFSDEELENPSSALIKFNQMVSTEVEGSSARKVPTTVGGKPATHGSRRIRTTSDATSSQTGGIAESAAVAALNSSQFALTEKRLHDHDFSTSHPQFSTMFEKCKARLASRANYTNQFPVPLDQSLILLDKNRRKLGAKNIINPASLCELSMQKSRESRKQRITKSKKILADILSLLSKE
jgi:WD40 repeat protein